jgi:hypothetical protein
VPGLVLALFSLALNSLALSDRQIVCSLIGVWQSLMPTIEITQLSLVSIPLRLSSTLRPSLSASQAVE